jgi:hypothetical protein
MTMKPEVIAHFNQMADQLLAGLRSVTGITEFTRVLERVEFDQRSQSHAVRLISESVC